jgi:putative MATE family efflux protein
MELSDVSKTIVVGSAPMLLGYGTVAFVGGVDAYFVARLGTASLGAFGFATALTALIGNLLGGFGIGVTACIARARGSKQEKVGVTDILVDCLLISGGFLSLIIGLLWLSWSVLIATLGAASELDGLIKGYIDIWLLGLIFVGGTAFGTAAIRGLGAMRASGLILVTGALINLALDPVLIFGFGSIPAFGLNGAALAIFISSALMLISVAVVLFRLSDSAVHAISIQRLCASGRSLLAVSVPTMISYAFVPLGMTLMIGLVSALGKEAVAAFGVAARLQSLLLIVPLSIASAVTPMVGTRFGARDFREMNDVARIGSYMAFSWGVALFLFFFVGSGAIGRLFSQDIKVEGFLTAGMPILALSFAPASFLLVICSALSSSGRAPMATLLLFVRGIGASFPLAALGGWLLGFDGIVGGLVAGNVVTALVARYFIAEQFWSHSNDKLALSSTTLSN